MLTKIDKQINCEFLAVDDKRYIKQTAKSSDVKKIIRAEPYILKDHSGKILAIHYLYDADKTKEIYNLMGTIKSWTVARRANGMTKKSKVFAYQPRTPAHQRDCCSASDLHFTNREIGKHLEGIAISLTMNYEYYSYEIFKKHKEWTDENVLKDWRFAGTPFTSGIINNGNALRYHRDLGNLNTVWSNMLVLKNAVAEGGNLILPEYNLELELVSGSVLMFNGSDVLHGVTPYKLSRPSGNRYSIVFYTLTAMHHCLTLQEEKKRFQLIRQGMEQKKYQALKDKL